MAQDALYWQGQALERVGSDPMNAVFQIQFAFNAEGGVFRCIFNDIVSADIVYPPTALQLQDALNDMITIGVGGATVTGVIRGPYEVEIGGGNAGQMVPPLLVDGTDLEPPHEVVPVLIRQGGGSLDAKVAGYWEDHADIANYKLRMLYCAADLAEFRLGQLVNAVDVTTGQVNVVTTKDSQRYDHMVARKNSINAEIVALQQTLAAGARRTVMSEMRRRTPNGLPFGELRTNPRTGRME
jgi:hypothetical protein